MNFIYEEFDNINHLLSTLEKRPKNEFMEDEDSSEREDIEFFGTKSYEEATNLLKFGYSEHLSEIKSVVRKNNLISFSDFNKKRIPKNMVLGFVPNVPNAIRNIPESMINVDRSSQKKKVMKIIYSIAGSCGVNKEVFIKAGIALVSAINIIELSGIQTQLNVGFSSSCEGSGESKEILCPVLRIKNFGERFNLEKICFPIIHPSMFRRIGFKYIETCPKMTKDFSCGYGKPAKLDELREQLNENENKSNIPTKILDTAFIRNNDYDIEEILKELGFTD